jgi:hypothetical protein
MAEYTCRSSVAFGRPNHYTLALACAILAYGGCELKGDLMPPRPQVPSLGLVSFSWRTDSVLLVRVVDTLGIPPNTVDIGAAG